MTYSNSSNAYENYGYTDVKSANNIEMIDELPPSNGNILASEQMGEKELLASIDVDNHGNGANMMNSGGGQWDSLLDSVKPQHQYGPVGSSNNNFEHPSNNENIDYDAGSTNMN